MIRRQQSTDWSGQMSGGTEPSAWTCSADDLYDENLSCHNNDGLRRT